MKKEKQIWFIALTVLCWLAPGQTFAQQNRDSTQELNEVVITASKFPKPQDETGKVMIVIDAHQIQRSAGKNLSQLLNEQTGLDINGANSTPGKDKSVYLRGAAGQYTLIVLNGVPISDPTGIGGAFDLRLISLDQIERIEILKGSQSTLYGSDAIAGVINILTKQKGNKPVEGQAMFSYGSNQTLKATTSIGGSNSWIDYSANYTHDQSQGISEAKEITGNDGFDRDGFDQNSLQMDLGYKPIEKLKVSSFFQFSDFRGQYDAGAFADDESADFRSKIVRYGLIGRYLLKKGAFQGQYSRLETDRTFVSGFGTYTYQGHINTGELFFNRDLNKYIQVSTGLQLQNFNMKDELAARKNPSVQIYSAYTAAYLRNFMGFSAEIGGRYNKHSVFGNAYTFSIHPSYLIDQKVKIFVNYSTGFKAPTLNELFGQFGANENLKPQDSRHAEAGIQYIDARHGLDLRATFFKRNIKNAILYANQRYINLDKQRDHGLELESAVQVNEKLRFRAYYTYVTGAVTTKTFANRDTSFNNLIRRPKNTIGAGLEYQATKKLFTNISLKSIGDRTDTYFDPNTFSSVPVNLTGYQLLNLYAEYHWLDGSLRGFIDAKNLLHQEYSEIYGYNALRLNVNIGVSYKF